MVLAALAVVVALAGCRSAGTEVECRTPPAKRAYFTDKGVEPTMDETLKQIVKCYSDEADARARAQNIGANAPAAVVDLLTQIYADAPVDTAVLADLGPEALNVLLRPAKDNYKHTTLLNEATRQANYRWVVALLEAGADPNGSGSLMAYTASRDIWDPRSNWAHLFKDGAPAVPFLAAYLEHGGDLDTTAEGGYGNGALINAPFNNLAATVFLLEQGADPWLTEKPPTERLFSLTMLGGRIFGALAADNNEWVYVLIRRGLFTMPDAPVYRDKVHDHYVDVLERLIDASGPERRHELWTVQKVVTALIDQGAFAPSARMVELLAANPVPDEEGGWVLHEGALHQPYDDPRIGAILGTEIW